MEAWSTIHMPGIARVTCKRSLQHHHGMQLTMIQALYRSPGPSRILLLHSNPSLRILLRKHCPTSRHNMPRVRPRRLMRNLLSSQHHKHSEYNTFRCPQHVAYSPRFHGCFPPVLPFRLQLRHGILRRPLWSHFQLLPPIAKQAHRCRQSSRSQTHQLEDVVDWKRMV